MNIITVTIGKLGGVTRAVDWDALPESSQVYLIHYGLKQKLNDSIASLEKGHADIEAEIGDTIDRLLDGTIEIRESSGTRGDPVRKRALQMAYDYLAKDKLKTKARTEKAKALVDASPRWLEMATEAIERDAALVAAMDEAESDDLVPDVGTDESVAA